MRLRASALYANPTSDLILACSTVETALPAGPSEMRRRSSSPPMRHQQAMVIEK
jgi:hypothetical protein